MSLKIYDSEQIRAWDDFTIKTEPVSSVDLMERAAGFCSKHILTTNLFESTSIFCGVGNNGGDGLVIARLLHQRGIKVDVFVVEFSTNRSTDFQSNLDRLPKEISIKQLTEKDHKFEIKSELIIDAIFGSGLNKEIDGWIANVVAKINTSKIKIVAIDLPSGLFCLDNKNNSLKNVIQANQTVTFQSPKMAFLFDKYSVFVGDVRVIDIGLSDLFEAKPFAEYITKRDIQLRTRETFSHKGNHGFLLVIAGFETYYGAAVLTSKAALRSGCGYVGTHCDERAMPILLNAVPECIYITEIQNRIPEKTTAIVIGPGLGVSSQSQKLLETILDAGKPLIIDADALNILSQKKELLNHLPKNSILTPHPRELERLIGTSNSPEETLEKQIEFSKKFGSYVLQKGAFSKLTTPDGKIYINSSGNAGMATAGTGDVLSGIIGSFLAQGYSPMDATINGMYIHGYCGDLVKRQHGERGMIASDIINALPQALNAF